MTPSQLLVVVLVAVFVVVVDARYCREETKWVCSSKSSPLCCLPKSVSRARRSMTNGWCRADCEKDEVSMGGGGGGGDSTAKVVQSNEEPKALQTNESPPTRQSRSRSQSVSTVRSRSQSKPQSQAQARSPSRTIQRSKSMSSLDTFEDILLFSAGAPNTVGAVECRNFGDLKGVLKFLLVQRRMDVEKPNRDGVIGMYRFQVRKKTGAFGTYMRFEQSSGASSMRTACKTADSVGKLRDDGVNWFSIPSKTHEASTEVELQTDETKQWRLIGVERVVKVHEVAALMAQKKYKSWMDISGNPQEEWFEKQFIKLPAEPYP